MIRPSDAHPRPSAHGRPAGRPIPNHAEPQGRSQASGLAWVRDYFMIEATIADRPKNIRIGNDRPRSRLQ